MNPRQVADLEGVDDLSQPRVTHIGVKQTAAEQIAAYRQEIDDLDQALAVLLQERVRIARLLGKAKNEIGFTLRDTQREAEVLRHITEMAGENLSAVSLRRVFRCIMTETLSAEEQDEA